MGLRHEGGSSACRGAITAFRSMQVQCTDCDLALTPGSTLPSPHRQFHPPDRSYCFNSRVLPHRPCTASSHMYCLVTHVPHVLPLYRTVLRPSSSGSMRVEKGGGGTAACPVPPAVPPVVPLTRWRYKRSSHAARMSQNTTWQKGRVPRV